MARVEPITELGRIAARHWRGTEEDRLGGWLLRAADGFTGRYRYRYRYRHHYRVAP